MARYLLPSVPAFLILVAAGVRGITRVWLARLCAIAMLLLSVYGSIVYLRYRSEAQYTDDWREATAYVAAQVRNGDAVVFYYHHERFPFQYYWYRFDHSNFRTQVIPAGTDEALLEETNPIESAEFAGIAAKSYNRIWLMYSSRLAATQYAPFSGLQNFYNLLVRRFKVSSTENFGFVQVILLAEPRSTSK